MNDADCRQLSADRLEMAKSRKEHTTTKTATTKSAFDEKNVVAAIKGLLADAPSLVAVAEALDLNVRTLQRRLAAQSQTYRQLLDDGRRQQAQAELCRGETSIAEISRQLGYSDPAHFVRAFRRWTGQAPSRYERYPPGDGRSG